MTVPRRLHGCFAYFYNRVALARLWLQATDDLASAAGAAGDQLATRVQLV